MLVLRITYSFVTTIRINISKAVWGATQRVTNQTNVTVSMLLPFSDVNHLRYIIKFSFQMIKM